MNKPEPFKFRGWIKRLHAIVPALLATVMLTLAGCAGDGGKSLGIISQSDPNTSLHGGFTKGIYRYDDKNNLTIFLLDGPIENPTQAVTIRLMWAPEAGRTPTNHTATNATIHYVIFSGDGGAQVGVYSGAGFVYPYSTPGTPTLDAGVWQASLRVTDKTPGFVDLLGQADVKGKLTALRDDAAVDDKIRRLNVMLRQKLGYPRMVMETQSPSPRINLYSNCSAGF